MTYTGRTAERLHRGSKLCAGCNQRVMVGDPRPSSTWPGQLYLTKAQCDLLLVAAAEYRDLSAACSKCDHKPHGPSCQEEGDGTVCGCVSYQPVGEGLAVSFTDWVSVDALRPPGHRDIPDHDGAPPRNNAGGLASAYQSEAHRHPDPIPVVSVRVWRRQAG